MNVILVTRDTVFGRYLAATLYGAGKLDRVIIETAHPTWRFYWRKFKRVGPVNALFGLLLNRWFGQEGAKHLANLSLPPHQVVRSVNGYSFGDEDLVIGFGTSYITARTLNGMKRGFLNLHTGWLPDYRGVKSEFWVLANRDPSRAGWTLHYMTPQLDAGDIVLRRAVPVAGENPAQLRAKLMADAAVVLDEFIDAVRRDGFEAIMQTSQEAGRYFTTPTWRDWRAYRRLRRASQATEGG